ncbi:MAG TPA: DNA polymerase III subunit alpha [Micropepsaceae bacterium]|nr:DNA polymerase III subunit alpha [Micropepsaceae bacterium]
MTGLSPFIHLRVHSAYSLLEGAIRVETLPELCRTNGMPAVGVTDTNNLFGAVEITEKLSGAGIQPIIGCTLSIADLAQDQAAASRKPGATSRMMPRVATIARNEAGWLNLMALASKAHLDVAADETPHVRFGDLEAHSDGLILLTGGPDGPVNRALLDGNEALARQWLEQLGAKFGDRLYVELQRHGLNEEVQAEGPLVALAYQLGLPLVATNEPFFATRAGWQAHDALLCIAAGRMLSDTDRRRVTEEHWFKPGAAMAELFADLPEAISNTVEIARRVSFMPPKRNPILPAFKPADGRTAKEELEHQAREGLLRRMKEAPKLFADEKTYLDRLAFELSVISRMGFEGYFLIVSDFMRWTRARGIPVGVRGSGATSIVAWALDITSLDPIRFNLVFERFLNPERVSMPDFDIDFCQDRRGEVIEYVQEKYGKDRVAQIITFGTLAARLAVRDVGRVMEMGYNQVDRICKLIPNVPGKQVKLKEAIAGDERLAAMGREEGVIAKLFEIAGGVEGLYRHASTHAAGIVIGDRPLTQLVPLYRDPRAEMPVTQFDYKDAETAGLVKFDFLGLKTLTVIAETERMLAARGVHVKAENVEFSDPKTFEMLSRGDGIGVFQLESQGMRDLMRRLKPDRIEDLIALVALYRPGPMDSIPKYIACKHGREKPDYLHPALEPILSETFGVMTYQEDVMRIARELAGYSMGEADLLRRAMGKKIKAEMDVQRERFVEGAKKNGIDAIVAREIFDQAAKFADYGFNKGHAAAYAHVAWQTAWLKANHTAEFLCASMTLDIGSTDRLNVFTQEASRLGIKVLPPDVNRSFAVFAVEADAQGNPAIRYALSAVRNVGRQAMEHLAAVRAKGGRFTSLFDFARRIDPKFVNKRALESLAAAGAFDSINPNRAQVLASADLMLANASGAQRDRESGQVSLFGGEGSVAKDPPLPVKPDWQPAERLQHEFEAVGFYLSGHPLDDYRTAMRRANVVTYGQLLQDRNAGARAVRIAGVVVARRDRKSQRGDTYSFVRFSDVTGLYEAVIFSDTLAQANELLQPGRAVVLNAVAEWQEEELKLRAQTVHSLDKVASEAEAGMRIFVDRTDALQSLKQLARDPGRGIISLVLMPGDGSEVEVELPGRYAVTPRLRGAIRAVQGVVDVEEV